MSAVSLFKVRSSFAIIFMESRLKVCSQPALHFRSDAQQFVICSWGYIMKVSDNFAILLILLALSYAVSMFVAV
ncbi:MAG TPA: hypothetical protein DCW35_04235 [Polynucleobacter sp.]|nr:hypothetical protein [Polynucleobacter sp.]